MLISARAAMEELHIDGCPVVSPETTDPWIALAWRRWKPVGPLMADYRHVASTLGATFARHTPPTAR